MGRRATGHVWLQGGRWHARLRTVYFGSFEDEQTARQVVKAALKIDADAAPDLLSVYGPAWLDARETSGLIRGIDSERSTWRQHIETAAFYDWPLRKIRPRDIDRWLRKLQQKRAAKVTRSGDTAVISESDRALGQSAVTQARRVLLSCLQSACLDGKLSSNPVREVRVPKRAVVVEDSDAWAWLTLAEIGQLFGAVDALENRSRALYYRAAFSVAIYVGLRQAEIWGLRWEDLDLDVERPQVRVRRSSRGPLKSATSRRNVPLLPAARDALRAWRDRDGVTRATGVVFPADGGGTHARGYDAQWDKSWRARATSRDYVTFHDLRHTCASHLAQGSWGVQLSLRELQDWLGHSSIAVTQRYSHLCPDALAGRVHAALDPAKLHGFSGGHQKST